MPFTANVPPAALHSQRTFPDHRPRRLRLGILSTTLFLIAGLALPDVRPTLAFAVDEITVQRARLAASDASPDNFFGASVTLAGDLALIGAPVRIGNSPGAAYFYQRHPITGEWQELDKLMADDDHTGNRFGNAVALADASLALVGAPRADGGQGAVYVYTRTEAGWHEQARLTASDGTPSQLFGTSIAVSGNLAMIGAAPFVDRAGAVYVFEYDPVSGQWTEQNKLTASDGTIADRFGNRIALDGDNVLIGAPGATVDGMQLRGVAYVFSLAEAGWYQAAKLVDADGTALEEFGLDVALDGSLALIGARGKPAVSGGGSQGAALLFELKAGQWVRQQQLTAADGAPAHNFGYSVAFGGGSLWIGAYSNGDVGEGVMYRFTWDPDTGTWTERERLVPEDGLWLDQFGWAIATDGDRVLVGAATDGQALGSSLRPGVAYVFGPPDPGLVITPDPVNFGQVAVHGQSVPRSLTLANTGANSEAVNQILLDDALFEITGGDCQSPPLVLAAGDHCTLDIVFTPGDNGPQSAALTVIGDAEGSMLEARLNGYGAPYVQTGRLMPSTEAPDGAFGGFQVALDGDTALAGAPLEQVNGRENQGAAYILGRDAGSGQWQVHTRLTAIDGTAGDRFGSSVALVGNVALVGAPSEESSARARVHVFERDSVTGQWHEQTSLLITGPGNRFGYSLALHGQRLLVLSPLHVSDPSSWPGAAIIHERDPATGAWTAQAELAPADGAYVYSGNISGRGIALHGDSAVLGSINADNWAGTAYVFRHDPDTGAWSEHARLSASDSAANEWFGTQMALYNDTLMIQSGSFDFGFDPGAGVYVFERGPGGDWTERTRLSLHDITGNNNNELMGHSIALHQDIAVFGAPQTRINGYNFTGAAFVFRRDPGTGEWSRYTRLTAAEGWYGDGFGHSVAFDGRNILVGAPRARPSPERDAYGAAYLFSPSPFHPPGPVLEITPDVLDFGATIVDQAVGPLGVTLANIGDEALVFAGFTAPMPPFAQVGGDCGEALMPDTQCTLEYRFLPTAPGYTEDAITMDSNAVNGPQTLLLRGTASVPRAILQINPATLDFGAVAVGETGGPLQVTLTNIGDATLMFTHIDPPPAPFNQTGGNCGEGLAPDTSCNLSYTFSPTTSGPASGQVVIDSNAAGGPRLLELAGSGAGDGGGPMLTIEPLVVDFGPVEVDTTSATQSVTLTNVGDEPLMFTGHASPPAPFAQIGSTCGEGLAPGTACTLDYTFSPVASGPEIGLIEIGSNDPESPHTLELRGSGLEDGLFSDRFQQSP